MNAQTYNAFFTLHGIVMIFAVVIPGLPAVFGNFMLPIMIGAKDVAFPRLNLLSWYLLCDRCYHWWWFPNLQAQDLLIQDGPSMPLTVSEQQEICFRQSSEHLSSDFHQYLPDLNFLVTIHRMRAPGMTWLKMPLFPWTLICHRMGSASCYSDYRDYPAYDRCREDFFISDFSIRHLGVIRFFISICSGLTAIRQFI